jgi:hypothetical protein
MTTSKRAAQPEERSLGGELRRQLKALLDGGQAHATFDQAIKNMPAALQGAVPEGLPYSAWQLLEHIRVTQRDILDFSRNEDGSYRALKWPEEYWPKNPEPPNGQAWSKSVEQIREDRKTFERLVDSVDDSDLIKPFPWGDGQNLLREALLIADHDAYHIGELVLLRRLLGAWKS